MPQSVAELNKLIAQARAEAARGSKKVKKAQKNQDKFKRQHRKAKNEAKRARKAKKPKLERQWERKQARAAKKIRHWTREETDAIEENRKPKERVARLKKKRAAIQPKGGNLASKGESYIGSREGGANHRKWCAELGYSTALPWCSIFVANMCIEAGVCTERQLPVNPAYTGNWIGWSGGRRVNKSEVQRGDILVFDWGDGGMTDHVGIYQGGGKHVGGNQSNAVTSTSTSWGSTVAVIRPR